MITLSVPRLSFMQFGYGQFNNGIGYCLPVQKDTDLAFQLILTTTTQAETRSIISAADNAFQLVLLKKGTTDPTLFAGNTYRNFTTQDGLFFVKTLVGANEVALTWSNPILNFDQYVPCGESFQLGFISIMTGFLLKYPSNTVSRNCSDDYTSVLEYSCEENNNGFFYCNNGFSNRVRVPLYILKPQFVDDEAGYLTSYGKFKVTRSVTKKAYQAATDYMDADTHEKIKVALSSDSVLIEDEEYSGGISKDGNYEIAWPDVPGRSMYAPASFKANATPYNVKNSNCADCVSFKTLALVDDYFPGILATSTNYQIDAAANDTIICNPAFTLLSFNRTYLVSASIDSVGTIYITTQGRILRQIGANPPVLLATYQVTCGSQTMTADVYGSFF